MITKQQISDATDALDMISHYAGISEEGLRLAKSALEAVDRDPRFKMPGHIFDWDRDGNAPCVGKTMDEALAKVEPVEPGHVDFTAGISGPTVELAWRDWTNAAVIHRVRVPADFCKTVIENGLSYRVKTPDLKHISPEALAFGAEVAESARLEELTKRFLNSEDISFKGVKVQSISTRVQILNEAAKLTSGDRDASYGDPKVNLSCAGELKQLAREWLAQGVRGALEPGEMEAIDQVLTKVARVLTGAYKRDNYVDGACYFAIAGECGEPTPSMVDVKVKYEDKARPAIKAAAERIEDLAREAQRKSAERESSGDTAPWKEEREVPKPDLSSFFTGAPRYHTGGPIEGEVPAILRRGETFGPARMLADVIANDIESAGAGAVMVIKPGMTRSEAKRALKLLFEGGDVYKPDHVKA